MNSRLVFAGLSASCTRSSDHSASNHHPGPSIALTRYPSAWKAAGLLHRFGLRHLAAGSPHRQAESSSLSLRTGHSPPVAPHPASRRRSDHRLQAGERLPEEDLHLSGLIHLQTHCHGQLACPCSGSPVALSTRMRSAAPRPAEGPLRFPRRHSSTSPRPPGERSAAKAAG
jgi:hypothetical protein